MDFVWTDRNEKLLVVAYWWERQHAICCICDTVMKPYRRDATNDPSAATIEHLVPRRDGGPNTVGNVRLAHAACNHAMGSLWSMNQEHKKRGIPPVHENHALAIARARILGVEPAPKHEQYIDPKEKRVATGGVKWNAGRAVSLPRGATLLPCYKGAVEALKANRVPKPKMTAIETARWLSQQGIRGA